MTNPPPQTASKSDLTRGDLTRHLIRLSLPMTWGIMMVVSFQLVDMFFVARLGTQALAALSFTFPVTFLVFSFFMGFSIATSSVVSRLIGSKEPQTIKRVTTHALILVLAAALGISAAGLALLEPLFRLMGAQELLQPGIYAYMSIWFPGVAFMVLPLTGNAALRAAGDAKTPALIMTFSVIVNIVLDPLLIFGLWGFPRLELQGAAIATVLANLCMAGLILYVLIKRKRMLCATGIWKGSFLADSARRLLSIALPVGLTNSIQPVFNSIVIGLLAAYGPDAVAAYGVVTRVEAFAFILLMGLAVGMAPIIGQNWGAGRTDRVEQTLRIALGFTVGWSLAIAVVLGIFARPVAGLFSNDPALIGYAALFFWIVPFSYAFSNLIHGWGSAFNAMGKPKRSFVMIVVKILLLLIPAVFIGEHVAGIAGIFIAIASVNLLAGTIFHLWSRRSFQAWRQECQTKAAENGTSATDGGPTTGA